MTPSEGKDPDSSDLKKNIYYAYFLTYSVHSFGFLIPLHTPSTVIVDFIGAKKSN